MRLSRYVEAQDRPSPEQGRSLQQVEWDLKLVAKALVELMKAVAQDNGDDIHFNCDTVELNIGHLKKDFTNLRRQLKEAYPGVGDSHDEPDEQEQPAEASTRQARPEPPPPEGRGKASKQHCKGWGETWDPEQKRCRRNKNKERKEP